MLLVYLDDHLARSPRGVRRDVVRLRDRARLVGCHVEVERFADGFGGQIDEARAPERTAERHRATLVRMVRRPKHLTRGG